jgi:hypothetical protein
VLLPVEIIINLFYTLYAAYSTSAVANVMSVGKSPVSD